MATVFANALGAPVAFARHREDERHFSARPHPDATQFVFFDERTNAALLDEIVRERHRFAVAGGQLLRDGAPVVLSPPGPRRQDLAALPATLAKLTSADPLTMADSKLLFRVLLRAVRELDN